MNRILVRALHPILLFTTVLLGAFQGVETAAPGGPSSSENPRGRPNGGDTPQSRLVRLDPSIEPMLRHFDAESTRTRLLAILSPTCSACAHGAEMIRRAVLRSGSPEKYAVLIIWAPMLQGDDERAAEAAARFFGYANARHFYDPGKLVGTAFRRDVFPRAVEMMRGSLPARHFAESALTRRDPDQPEWDIYMIFDPGVGWEAETPAPSRWVRQIARFGEPGHGLRSLMWINEYSRPPVEGDLGEELRKILQ
jgi:hypothetical protein